uniref:Uncharacterized protein n=1 Tax=Trypanosoma vivax (strain Y486) TaxID=1055687 RepID=G0UB54_TRYVY|nr:hypothetical protein, unlikely [Trypanosoma vivax Y486]
MHGHATNQCYPAQQRPKIHTYMYLLYGKLSSHRNRKQNAKKAYINKIVECHNSEDVKGCGEEQEEARKLVNHDVRQYCVLGNVQEARKVKTRRFPLSCRTKHPP